VSATLPAVLVPVRPQLLDVAAVAARLSIHPRTIYALARKDPTFPKPVRLLADPRWSEDELAAYIELLKMRRDAAALEEKKGAEAEQP
jgi:predicted DNA-binding transcriptional regulator AlpA